MESVLLFPIQTPELSACCNFVLILYYKNLNPLCVAIR